jgi:hypothetical protein
MTLNNIYSKLPVSILGDIPYFFHSAYSNVLFSSTSILLSIVIYIVEDFMVISDLFLW